MRVDIADRFADARIQRSPGSGRPADPRIENL
jgi:hypothetical protein